MEEAIGELKPTLPEAVRLGAERAKTTRLLKVAIAPLIVADIGSLSN